MMLCSYRHFIHSLPSTMSSPIYYKCNFTTKLKWERKIRKWSVTTYMHFLFNPKFGNYDHPPLKFRDNTQSMTIMCSMPIKLTGIFWVETTIVWWSFRLYESNLEEDETLKSSKLPLKGQDHDVGKIFCAPILPPCFFRFFQQPIVWMFFIESYFGMIFINKLRLPSW